MILEWLFAALNPVLAASALFVAASWMKQDRLLAERIHPVWGLLCVPAVVFSTARALDPDESVARRLSAGGFACFAAVVCLTLLASSWRARRETKPDPTGDGDRW